ncbi:hypothetical protein AB1K70_21585 [Bremerella sp. JC770]|uniref:hypothetical protein n=1 Tax=Bremerella sp. JC770 TaxID=3232137 RepID=UPI003457D8CB
MFRTLLLATLITGGMMFASASHADAGGPRYYRPYVANYGYYNYPGRTTRYYGGPYYRSYYYGPAYRARGYYYGPRNYYRPVSTYGYYGYPGYGYSYGYGYGPGVSFRVGF